MRAVLIMCGFYQISATIKVQKQRADVFRAAKNSNPLRKLSHARKLFHFKDLTLFL